MDASLLFPELSNPQSALEYPQTLSEKYRPQSIDSFAGLSEPKRILAGFVRNPTVKMHTKGRKQNAE